ncbi:MULTISPECIES: exodeoxyribonuclease V subunit gamma [unclassified Oleiphilus]|nr:MULTISPECIES: exodeoxyribonuclease V subunit gamma [unclassified Oleiphilus]KZY68543.1 hypothetical protein A3739_11055 [Oleiphilus sp. HI0067]KZY71760.1 hypothetical protein A3738_03635 [Oleiphilus sp. HI0066]
MLYLYPSNKTANLATVLAEIMRADPLADPFESDIILTQSHGMGVWLNQQISANQGVSCMIDSMMPGAFLWSLMDKLDITGEEDGTGAVEQNSVQHFEKSNLRWEIFRQLPDLIERDEFQPVRQYIQALVARESRSESEQTELSPAILFQVSELLADNFDAYQNYRPDWIDAWEQGGFIDNDKNFGSGINKESDEAWQRSLWLNLYPGIPVDQRHHRSAQLQSLTRHLAQSSVGKAALPKRLFIFGLAAIPPQWLPLFLALGKHIDIHFLFQNPSRAYWADIVSEKNALKEQMKVEQSAVIGNEGGAIGQVEDRHPLLASLGQLGKNYLAELYQYDEESGLTEFDADFYTENDAHSALCLLKNDLLHGQINAHEFDSDDESIRFASCHSKLRELESLRDYLLSAFDKDSSLSSKDVIVMAPDIQSYGPLVHAVFGEPIKNKAGQTQRIQYGISDHALSFEQPLLESLIKVLSFDQSRLGVDEFLELMSVEAVRSRFEMDDAQLECLQHLVGSLNVRWGLSEKHRDQVSGGEQTGSNNTWLQGIQRALKSYLLGDMPALKVEQDFVPISLRTRESQDLVGMLASIIDLIEDCMSVLSGKQPTMIWINRVQAIWQQWFDLNIVDESVQRLIDRALDSCREQVMLTQFDQTIPFSIIRGILQTELDKEKVSQRFLAGRMNFCNLMPMRTVPFRLVCLLGMNEGEYPRHDLNQSFDLIAQYPKRRGDRSRRFDDRYMFLEAILAAQDRLYISYQGKHAKDNSERFPSVLVSELQDALVRTFTDGSEQSEEQFLNALSLEHRLQPFHRSYFESTSETPSFSNLWRSLYLESADQIAPIILDEAAEQIDMFSTPQTSDVNVDASPEPSASRFIAQIKDAGHCTLRDWEQAFASPLLHYYRTQLGLTKTYAEEVVEAIEPFDLFGLDAYKVAQELAPFWLHDRAEDEARKQKELALLGRLPQGLVAELKLDSLKSSYGNFIERIAKASCDAEASKVIPYSFELTLPENLTGSSMQGDVFLAPETAIDVRFGKYCHKWIFGAWAKHVAWNAHVHSGNDVSKNKASAENNPTSLPLKTTNIWRKGQIVFPALTAEQAGTYLSELVQCLVQFSNSPLPFLPEQAYKLAFAYFDSSEKAYNECELGNESALVWNRLGELSEDTELGKFIPEPDEYVLMQQILRHAPVKKSRSKKKDDDSDIAANDDVERITVEEDR